MSKSSNRPGEGMSIPTEWAAFCAFIEAHYPVIYSVALAHVRDGEVAQEIAQDVCVRLLLERDTLPALANASGWLARVARNTAIDWVRRRQTHSRILAKMEAMNYNPGGRNSPPEDARTAAMGEEKRHRLMAALEKVTPETREMLLLHFNDRLEKQEIARLLEVHPSTIGRRMDEGLRTLRKLLSSDDATAALSRTRPANHTARAVIATLGLVASLSAADKAALAAMAAPLPTLGAAALQPTAPSLITLVKNTDWSSLMKSKGFMISTAAAGAIIITGVLIDRNSRADSTNNEQIAQATPATAIHALDNPALPNAPQVSTPARKFELASSSEPGSSSNPSSAHPTSTSAVAAPTAAPNSPAENSQIPAHKTEESKGAQGQVLDDLGNSVSDARVTYRFMTGGSVTPPATPNNVRVSLASQPVMQMGQTHTDKNGYFNLKALANTSETLITVSHESFAMHMELVQLPVENLVIRLRQPYTYVSGRVIDMQTQVPVPYAALTFMPQLPARSDGPTTAAALLAGDILKTKADANGHFIMDQLPEGPFSIDATSTNGLQLAPTNRAIYTTATASASVPLVLPDIEMYPGYTIKGQVRDFHTKAPIAGAEVGFSMGANRMGGARVKPVLSDEQGYYTLTGATPTGDPKAGPGAMRFLFLSANATGYRSNTAIPKIDSFDINQLEITQDIELSPGEPSDTIPLAPGRFVPTPR